MDKIKRTTKQRIICQVFFNVIHRVSSEHIIVNLKMKTSFMVKQNRYIYQHSWLSTRGQDCQQLKTIVNIKHNKTIYSERKCLLWN